MALLSLGMFIFSVPTLAYSELQRSTEWRFARNGRVLAREAAQYVGPGEDTVSLSGVVYSEIADGAVSIDMLRDMADRGEAYPLVCADGRVYGAFVITRLEERHGAFWPDGSPRSIEFTIELLHVDDPAAGMA